MKKLISVLAFVIVAGLTAGFFNGTVVPQNQTFGLIGLGLTVISLTVAIIAFSSSRERYSRIKKESSSTKQGGDMNNQLAVIFGIILCVLTGAITLIAFTTSYIEKSYGWMALWLLIFLVVGTSYLSKRK